MLVMLAMTGVLRGLQDTRTPLVVAVAANGREHRAQPRARLRRSTWASPGRRSAPSLAQSAGRALTSVVVVRGAGAMARRWRRTWSGFARWRARAAVPLVVRTLRCAAVAARARGRGAASGRHRARGPPGRVHDMDLPGASRSTPSRSPGQALTGRYLGAGDVGAPARRRGGWWSGVSVRRRRRGRCCATRALRRAAVHHGRRGAGS